MIPWKLILRQAERNVDKAKSDDAKWFEKLGGKQSELLLKILGRTTSSENDLQQGDPLNLNKHF